MTQSQTFFLELLRAGLWNEMPDMSLDWKSVDWKSVEHLMRTQTVVGVCMDAIAKLPTDLRPDHKLFYRGIFMVRKMEEQNAKMNHFVPKVMKALEENGCGSLLLKGQGVAMNYPNPLHRVSVDIDLFVGFDDDIYEKAIQVLTSRKVVLHDNNKKRRHAELQLGDIVIEIHGSLGTSISNVCDNNMRAWAESRLHGENVVVNSADGDIVMPPYDFDVLFIFVHLLNHYMNGGIGLRQVCDWLMYMYKNYENIDSEQLQKDIEFLGIGKQWGLFASMAVKYMGYPSDRMFLYDAAYDDRCNRIVSHIFKTGNFGTKQKEWQLSGKSNPVVKKIVTLFGQIPVYLDNFRLFPKETAYCFGKFFKGGIDSL